MKTLLATAAVAAIFSLSSLMLGCSGAPSSAGESSAADLSADSTETADAAKSALVGTFTAVGTNPLKLAYMGSSVSYGTALMSASGLAPWPGATSVRMERRPTVPTRISCAGLDMR